MESSDALHALGTFRRSFYECLHRRTDALFELTDALLTAEAAVPSPVHLSLQASHRRGWGSLYAALDRGQIDAQALRGLLVRHPLAGSGTTTPIYAVDVSVWDRCDAECSPERGYYYHPSRHSAGQPIVAGWAYQFIAQLNFVRESWTAPLDVERVRPAQDANEVATEPVRAFVRLSPEKGVAPLFVFDAGYDPVKVQLGLEGSPCQILVRLRAGRRFYSDPSLAGPPAHTGRPRRSRSEDEVCGPKHLVPTLYGVHMRGRRLRSGACARLGEVASQGAGARKAWQPRASAHRGRDARVGGGRAVAPGREAARTAGCVAVVAWPRRRTRSRSHLASLREALRPGAYLPLPQTDFGMDHPSGASS
jgi:hypothetical protein